MLLFGDRASLLHKAGVVRATCAQHVSFLPIRLWPIPVASGKCFVTGGGVVTPGRAFNRLQVAHDSEGTSAALPEGSFWRTLISHAHDVMVVLEPWYRIRYVTPAVTELLGHPADFYEGETLLALIHPADIHKASGALAAATRPPELPKPQVLRLRASGESWRGVEITVHDLSENPAVEGILVVIRPHSEEPSVNWSKAANEPRNREFLDSLHEIVFQTDATGHWTYLNQAWTKVTGFSVEDSLGRSFVDSLHPEEVDSTLAMFRAVVSEHADYCQHEGRYRTADGRYRWVELRASVVYDEAGRVTGNTGTLIDITERRETEERLRRAEERYRALVEHVPGIIYTAGFGAMAPWTYVSPQVEVLLGFSVEEWTSSSVWYEQLHPDDRARVITEEQRDGWMLSDDPYELEYRLIGKDGRVVWVSDKGYTIRDAEGMPLFYEGVLFDVTRRKELEHELTYRAFHDAITDLPNRELLRDRLEHALSLQARDKRKIAVIFLDVDDFKTINDSLGHAAGDEVLAVIGARLRECLRPSDTAARMGGDEFAVLVEDVDETSAAAEVAERIGKALLPPVSIEGRELAVQASMGIATSDPDANASSASELLRDADIAMYLAKEENRGSFRLFEQRMHRTALDRLERKAALEVAVRNGDFELLYQPIVDLHSHSIAGAEALLRWRHPRGELVAPELFIPLAEETGLIVPLGGWVLTEAWSQARRLHRSLPDTRLLVCVNLSPHQLRYQDLISHVRSILKVADLDPSNLVLEITESELMHDEEALEQGLRELKSLGVRLAIDDFGTGNSSLSSLSRLPIDIVKIDQSFCRGLARDQERAALVGAIIHLGKTLQLCCIAEGVEEAEDAGLLAAMGCDLAQGNHFAPPLDEQALRRLVRSPPTT